MPNDVMAQIQIEAYIDWVVEGMNDGAWIMVTRAILSGFSPNWNEPDRTIFNAAHAYLAEIYQEWAVDGAKEAVRYWIY